MTEKLTASFTGYVPDKSNAISIHGSGGGQLTLEFSDSDIAEALKLVAMRGKLIKVTIEELETPKKPLRTPKRGKTKKADQSEFVD